MTVIALFVGGFVGGILRYALGTLVPNPGAFPLGILLINLIGSFFLGVLYGLMALQRIQRWLRVGVGVGLIGSFTTFSTFCTGVDVLSRYHELLALGYILLSVVGGPVLAYLGDGVAVGFSRRAMNGAEELPTGVQSEHI